MLRKVALLISLIALDCTGKTYDIFFKPFDLVSDNSGIANMLPGATYTATSPTTGYISLSWDEAAYSELGATGNLTATDFTLVFNQNGGSATGASIACVTDTASTSCPGNPPAPGATEMRVHLTITGISSGVETVTLYAAAGQIFSAGGKETPDSDNTGPITLPDFVQPTVVQVTAVNADGAYGPAQTIQVLVVFSENVVVTGTPQLTLETGSSDAVVDYSSGSGSNTLVFDYTVAAGHTSPDLDYISTTALSLNGGTIRDTANNNALLSLPTPGGPGSLAANKNIIIDTTAPTVTLVTSPNPDAIYPAGQTILIHVLFSEPVNVTGTPQITLETGTNDAVVNYSSGSGTNTLVFSYTVAAGHTSLDLDYVSTSALVLNGGTIRDAAGNNAVLTLPNPGATGSLSANKEIKVDAIVPTISHVTSSTMNGTYGIGQTIVIQVVFSEPVTVTGTPQLTLETGASDAVVNYSSGSGTNTLVFNYTVAAGHVSADLDYISTTALSLNGGTIRDNINNDADLTLPAPGATGSLGANKNLVIDGIVPTVTNVTSSTVNGIYKAGDVIVIQVVFSEPVTVTGTPQLTLETGASDAVVNYSSGSGTNTLVFNYTVAAGHTSPDLDYVS
ncbi:MAG: hypothetical protein N2Z22_08470, partial [Turneriella sp.]|nr:hypothetical protein [Turneriella sp.]